MQFLYSDPPSVPYGCATHYIKYIPFVTLTAKNAYLNDDNKISSKLKAKIYCQRKWAKQELEVGFWGAFRFLV